jgi:molybdopterin-guanine dinucleotide biosynthesis protein A
VEHIAEQVRLSAETVTLIGSPERYRHLSYPVLPDESANRGPLGGIVTALAHSQAQWNLVVACDMPSASAELFDDLFAAAEHATGDPDCIVPMSSQGLEPLCAVYHLRALPPLRAELEAGNLTMQDVVSKLNAHWWPVMDDDLFENVNTPEEWSRHD